MDSRLGKNIQEPSLASTWVRANVRLHHIADIATLEIDGQIWLFFEADVASGSDALFDRNTSAEVGDRFVVQTDALQ
jgi:hypothetical protein